MMYEITKPGENKSIAWGLNPMTCGDIWVGDADTRRLSRFSQRGNGIHGHICAMG